MHNNFYFLKKLSSRLNDMLEGYVLTACFTQNKNELVLAFGNKNSEFFIKAHLDPAFCCLSFPVKFSRARKNSVNLFDQLLNKKISGTYQFENERCFALIFEDNYRLLFKMHGNRSNIILYHSTNLADVFKKNLAHDLDLDINTLDRPIDQSYEAFLQQNGDYLSLFPTFGKVVKNYLQDQGLDDKNIDERWVILQSTLKKLAHPSFYITSLAGQLQLSLLDTGSVQAEFSDPVEAISSYYVQYISDYALRNQKRTLLIGINRDLKQSVNYVKKVEAKLREIENRQNYSHLADILMANLHRVPLKAREVTLEDFYNDNVPVTINLKRDLSPQKNAEAYYRKAKNQSLEIKHLKENLSRKRRLIKALEEQKLQTEAETDLKTLRKRSKKEAPEDKSRPFVSFEFQGYTICVGKNARSNDKMLQQYSFKEDLWLHAREASGSHVLLKYQAGKKFPKHVIEKAAELAAYYSKRKSDSLCPVIVTPRKFIRKRKGDPAGAVAVDKEEQILLVRPGK